MPTSLSQFSSSVRAMLVDGERQLNVARENYKNEIVERRKLHNQLLELRGNIRVFVRVRPISSTEYGDGLSTFVSFPRSDQLAVSQSRSPITHTTILKSRLSLTEYSPRMIVRQTSLRRQSPSSHLSS